MKPLISTILIGLFLLTFILSPGISLGRTMDDCYDDHNRCSTRALQGDYGVIKTSLLLTTCDAALMVCIVANYV